MHHPVRGGEEGPFLVIAILLLTVFIVTNAAIVGLAVWYVRSRIWARDRWRVFFIRGILISAACFFLGVPVLSWMRDTSYFIVGLGVFFAPGIGAIAAALLLRHRQSEGARWRKRYSDR